ncbi:hypothetical protein [Nocardia sp. NPDC055049]
MTVPEPMPDEQARRVLRDAARYTAVVLLVGHDPDRPGAVFIDEVRNPARELADRDLVRALRELADRVEGRING